MSTPHLNSPHSPALLGNAPTRSSASSKDGKQSFPETRSQAELGNELTRSDDVEPAAGPELCRAERRRPLWRRRLVDAERGLTEGFRGDSAFFVHFFGGSVSLTAAAVLGVPFLHGCLIVLCLAAVLTAELFHRALVAGFEELAHSAQVSTEVLRKTRRISTAAVMVTTATALLTVALVLGRRLWETFSG